MGLQFPYGKKEGGDKDCALRQTKQRHNLRKSAFFNHISEENVAHLKKKYYLCSEILKNH